MRVIRDLRRMLVWSNATPAVESAGVSGQVVLVMSLRCMSQEPVREPVDRQCEL